MNLTEFLIRALSQTETWAQTCIVFGIFGLTAFQLIWVFWERRQNQRIRSEREEFRIRFELVSAQLAALEKRAEQDRQDRLQQVADWKAQANHDRSQLRQAIPAFERVIRQNDALLDRNESARLQLQKLRAELAQFQTMMRGHQDLKAEFADAAAKAERLQAELAAFQKRSDDLQHIDADVWIAPANGPERPPAFIYREQRPARFVAFLNLKGGVGKTTLTANLAAAYATGVLGKKLRVLAVDLDYQGTLGNLCVETRLLADRRATYRTADRLLDPMSVAKADELLRELCVPLTNAEGAMVIVADDKIDQADFRQQAVYAVERTEVRFCHRRFFHQPAVFEQFDLVFFDCPPRLTTSSINALAACDWIVVPTALDPNDVEAVPRTLQLLEKLQKKAQIDFHMNLGGILLNSTYHGGTTETLTSYEKDTFGLLKQGIGRFAPSDEMVLKQTVKDSSQLIKAAAEKVPWGADADGREFFRAVAEELYQRIKH